MYSLIIDRRWENGSMSLNSTWKTSSGPNRRDKFLEVFVLKNVKSARSAEQERYLPNFKCFLVTIIKYYYLSVNQNVDF